MTAVYNAADLSRSHFAGADADVDIHIEAYEGDIDGSFRVKSLFRESGLTNFKSVGNSSNTWRGDRVGGATVSGRKSGETLGGKRITNEKFIVTVDTTSFIRTPFDYQDDWTSPDFQAEYSAEHGTAHAKSFDTAHIIQLIKCGDFTPPASLTNFFPGLKATATGYAAAAADALRTKEEVQADILVQMHKDFIEEFVNRDLGDSLGELVTLMTPEWFSRLLDHKKLMNVDFQSGSSDNNFTMRRVAWLNGVRVVETPRFPTAAITDHHLGAAFNVSAGEAKARMIVYFPKKALVTIEAKGMTVRHWDDPKDFQSVLDSYTMYTVGQKRPDAVAIGFAE